MRRGLLAIAGAALIAAACGRDSETDIGSDAAVETAAAPLSVDEVRLGKTLGADRRVTEESDDFRPTETVYASVRTSGTAANAVLVARWTYQDGQVVSVDSQTIAPSGTDVTEFHISNPGGWPAGEYRLTVLLDGREVGSKEFEVEG